MSDLLTLGSNGVLAYQRTLVTVSNNIANVATDGYSRQQVGLESLLPRSVGNDYIGTGVAVSGVARQYDEFIERNLRGSLSQWVGQEPLVRYANRVIDLMAGEETGLNPALTRFFEAARTLSVSSASTISRSGFIGEAGTLASSFRQLDEQLRAVDEESLSNLNASAEEANTIAEQLALVNRQLQVKDHESRQPPELLDQRDRLLKELSRLMQITASFRPNGEVTVGVNGSLRQGILVSRDDAQRLQVRPNPDTGRVELRLGLLHDSETLAGLSGGELGGLIAFREQVLLPARQRLDDIARTMVGAVNAVHRSGIDALGEPGGDLFGFDTGSTPAAGMSVLIEDPRTVAAASPFRITANSLNVGTAVATVSYEPFAPEDPADLSAAFVSTGLESAPASFEVALGHKPIAAASAGLVDPTLWITPDEGQWPQLITRDGRHLLGSALDASQRAALMASDGMMAGATYSDTYLNPATTAAAYRQADYFLGVLAEPMSSPVYDSQTGDRIGSQPVAARIDTGPMSLAWPSGIAAGALTINGVALPALSTPTRSQDLADWINTVQASTGVRAEARNELRLVAGQVFVNNTVGSTLTLASTGHGTATLVTPAGGYDSVDDLAAAINAQVATSGVMAHVSEHGDLVLSGVGTEHLTVGGDLLNASGTYAGQLTLTAADTTTDIKIGFGAGGTPDDLARLGLPTGVYWRGTAPEDLLYFVTGNGQADVRAAYRDDPFDAREALRDNPVRLEFTAADRYTLTDVKTGSVLADRPYDPHDAQATIDYRGLSVHLSRPPQIGDRYVIDGNDNGLGDNRVILEMAALESEAIFPGGRTLAEAYLQQTSVVGNVARQAGIALDALEVVHQQALEARDAVSGVNMDEEAADLIRYQQAYQANAKVMQAASTLFDTLLGIR